MIARTLALAALVLAMLPRTAAASDFFSGAQIRVIIGTDAAGTYDVYARAIAPHLARHLHKTPPTLIMQNMAGAGSMIAMNYLYTVAPKDGTTIGAMNPAGLVEPMFNPASAKYDPTRFVWLGSLARDTEVVLASGTSGITRFDELMTKELVTGSTGASAFASMLPRLVNNLIGTRMKVVEGYKGASAIVMAIENGEVAGYGSASWSGTKTTFPHLLESKRLNVIAQYGLSPRKELDGVPMVIEFAKTEEDRAALRLMLTGQEIGRPYMAPPGIPDELAAAYRTAFGKLVKDEAFLKDMEAKRLPVDPLDADQTLALVKGILGTPPEVVARVKSILGR